MARNKKNSARRRPHHGEYNKMRARTEKLNTGVRLAFCGLGLMLCVAFMVAALQPYKELNKMKAELSEVQAHETGVIESKDAKVRELRAVEEDPAYLEIIARDRLDYYKPGEQIFRIER